MRIGIGIVAGENEVTFVLVGPAVHLLDGDTDDLVDGDDIAKFRLRLARNFAMSSPSTRSSVSPSSRWTAGPTSTKVTSFSPATMPMPMRMASKARPVARGSWVMRTRTGSSATTTRSVERDEALGRVDQVGQHHEAAVGHAVGVVEREAALLAAIRAHEQLGAAVGQRAHARIVERTHAVVDQVEIEIGATRARPWTRPAIASPPSCACGRTSSCSPRAGRNPTTSA